MVEENTENWYQNGSTKAQLLYNLTDEDVVKKKC